MGRVCLSLIQGQYYNLGTLKKIAAILDFETKNYFKICYNEGTMRCISFTTRYLNTIIEFVPKCRYFCKIPKLEISKNKDKILK